MPKNNIFCNGKTIHQPEMLVHHCNSILQTMTWAGETNLRSITQHRTFIWFVQTTQHRSKGALTSSIFAKQRMYFAWEQIEVHTIVCKNTRETFGYLTGR